MKERMYPFSFVVVVVFLLCSVLVACLLTREFVPELCVVFARCALYNAPFRTSFVVITSTRMCNFDQRRLPYLSSRNHGRLDVAPMHFWASFATNSPVTEPVSARWSHCKEGTYFLYMNLVLHVFKSS